MQVAGGETFCCTKVSIIIILRGLMPKTLGVCLGQCFYGLMFLVVVYLLQLFPPISLFFLLFFLSLIPNSAYLFCIIKYHYHIANTS